MRQSLPLFVKLWFAADLVLALLPPLHWAAGSGASIFGAPVVLVYFFGSGIFVTASVLAAYACDPNMSNSSRESPALVPLPLAGRGKGWGSGRASPPAEKSSGTPTPDPSPQGGGGRRTER